MNFSQIQRAQLLIGQDRASEAEKILLSVHAEMSDSALVKYLLSECRFMQQDYKTALEYINDAIGLNPEDPDYFAQKANILNHKNHDKEAFENIEIAIGLSPENPVFWGMKAAFFYDDRQYEKALNAADEGLSHDPEQSICLNIRSLSLAKLNRLEEANETIQDTLRSNPNNSFTYASQGHIALQNGKPKEALELFREALRIDPASNYAKAGLVESLKSRFFIYRWFYRFFDWMGRQNNSIQWIFIIGIFIARRLSSYMAQKMPDLAPVFDIITGILIAFIFLTWIIVPLSNLLLRLNTYGKYALDKDQITSSNWTGILLLLALILYISGLIFKSEMLELFSLMVLLTTLPVNCIYNFKYRPEAKQVYWFSIAVILLGFVSIFLLMQYNISLLFFVFIVCFIYYQIHITRLALRKQID